MAKVSKRFLNKDLEDYMFDLFVKAIIDLDNPIDVKNFLEDLLSPVEKTMLMKRLAIAILLSKGYTYDEIDNTLKVSRPTIMIVSFFLKNGQSGYKKAVERIVKSQKREEFIDKIEEILIQLSPPKRYGSLAFEKKQKVGKELYKKKKLRSSL